MAGALALPVAARAGGLVEDDLKTRAIEAMGGRGLLLRIKTLTWEGRGEVVAGGRTVLIKARTRCEPFGAVSSRTWLADQGPATTRVMTLRDGKGTVTDVNGKPVDFPPAMAAHEQLQFGIYGYMLLVHAAAQVQDAETLVLRHPRYPPATIAFGTDGLAVSAEYDVTGPDGNATIRQRFLFANWKTVQGVRWPHGLAIFQDDKPFFTSNLDSFSVELA